jgi:hypothetical protein
MSEAAEPDVFAWYVRTNRPDANAFVDHSQIVQLECRLRPARGAARSGAQKYVRTASTTV